MKVLITGATGFIGRHLTQLLLRDGCRITAVSRDVKKAHAILGAEVDCVEWDGKNPAILAAFMESQDAVINLAGENVGQGSWTPEKKRAILESRVQAGKAVTDAIRMTADRPKTLVQASAIGYYGDRSDEVLNESSAAGDGFLAEVTREWERSSKDVETLGVRRVIIRTSPVLHQSGGSLPQMMLPFRYFIGGVIGSGTNWFSWIHLNDEIGAIRFLLNDSYACGVFNLASPSAIRMQDFLKTLGGHMKRPTWFKTPAFVMRLLLVEKSDELIFSSKRVTPERLLNAGYQFLFPNIENALNDIFRREP